MHAICKPVTKKDHTGKFGGSDKYVADLRREGMLHCRLVRSPHAKARIVDIKLPQLPDGYYAVDKDDVPGKNRVPVGLADIPVFAEGTVEYIGDPVLMILGPDADEVERLVKATEVVYEQLPAVLDIHDADEVFHEYNYGKGDMDAAFAEADFIYEEIFHTGHQEQAYLEPQGIMAEYIDGTLHVHGSLQCPYYVHDALLDVMGNDNVRVQQDVTGGGFGGKEAWPSVLAGEVAVASLKAGGKPVQMIFDRREDMEFTSKRHPSECVYKLAVKDGRVTALDADIIYDAGAFSTLSAVVLQRGIIAACGVYNIPNLKVHGRAVKTNTVPSGAFRGFGAPQTFITMETAMAHIAKKLGVEPMEFKKSHLVKQGDSTGTSGKYHFPVPLPAMIDAVEDMCGYSKKRKEYANQTGRYRKGIGMSMWFHGAGFTGSGERDVIKALVKLHKFPDGRVEVLAANSDIGQGIKTTFCKIVANELGIELDRVLIQNPDTGRVPDSGPTVASRSLMVVGGLLRKAAIKLKAEWEDGADQIIEERYQQPDFMIPFDITKFHGDAYPTYSWAVCAVELQIDTVTGSHEILGAWESCDVGTPVDENIVTGQMEGGLLQGLGYASMEQMRYDNTGRIRNNSYSDYIIPASMDVPEMKIHLHVEEYPEGPYGAKGAGELPLVGVPAAYLEAVEHALQADLHHIPFSAEDSIQVLQGGK